MSHKQTQHHKQMSITELLMIFWHAPLGVLSTKCRHQSPQWTILSHVVQGRPSGLLQFFKDEAAKIFLASAFVWHSHYVAEQREMPCIDSKDIK